MKDVYLIFHGRAIKSSNDQMILRNATAIISDVMNQTMGGNGAREAVYNMWPIYGEPVAKQLTPEEDRAQRKRIIEYHNMQLLQKRKSEVA